LASTTPTITPFIRLPKHQRRHGRNYILCMLASRAPELCN
jgi:hypothetical protein